MKMIDSEREEVIYFFIYDCLSAMKRGTRRLKLEDEGMTEADIRK